MVGRPTIFTGSDTVLFAKMFLATTLLTTIVWVVVTMLTKREPDSILLSFYRRVRPDVTGWKAIATLAPENPENARHWAESLVLDSGLCDGLQRLFGVGKFAAAPLAAGDISASDRGGMRLAHG